MRHIAVTSFSDGPCNGLIEERPILAAPAAVVRLPILGAGSATAAIQEWQCTRCGQRWPHEPLPQDAL